MWHDIIGGDKEWYIKMKQQIFIPFFAANKINLLLYANKINLVKENWC